MTTLLTNETFQIISAQFTVIKPYRLTKPFQDSGMGPFETFGFAILTLTDADGFSADVPLSPGAVGVLETLFLPRLLTASPIRYNTLFRQLYRAMRNEGFRSPHVAGPLGSIDLALYGMAAQRAKQPLHRFLGATRDWVRVYACGGGTNLHQADLLAEASDFAGQGYDLIKVKVGRHYGQAIAEDVARVKSLRQHLGPAVGLAVDANQIWSVEEALRFIEQVAEYDIHWIEEPIHSADITGLQTLCRQSAIRVAMGESEVCGRVFPALADAGVHHLQPQPMHMASIQEWLETRDLVTRNSLFLSAGGFSHLACSFVATADETAYTEMLVDIIGPMSNYYSLQPTLTAGRFELLTEPGLPVRFDWEKLNRTDQIGFQKTWTAADFGPAKHTVL